MGGLYPESTFRRLTESEGNIAVVEDENMESIGRTKKGKSLQPAAILKKTRTRVLKELEDWCPSDPFQPYLTLSHVGPHQTFSW